MSDGDVVNVEQQDMLEVVILVDTIALVQTTTQELKWIVQDAMVQEI